MDQHFFFFAAPFLSKHRFFNLHGADGQRCEARRYGCQRHSVVLIGTGQRHSALKEVQMIHNHG